MKKIRVTYFALAALVSVASCSKEAAEPDVYDWAEGEIYFKTSLSDVVSRADDMTLDHLESFQVTCFNTGDLKKDAAGFIAPYFEDATFIRQQSPVGITYMSSPDEGPRDWPANSGTLKFFAFSPSRAVMAAGNTAIDANRGDYFNLINSSTDSDNSVSVGYQLGKVRVNPDVSAQFDFVTAEASGERWKDFNNGVDLAFRHQLSQVELKAWGAPVGTKFEIAGVRLGNPVVEGTFVFSAYSETGSSSAGWSIADDALTDKVEYLYRGATYTADADGEIAAAGDRIFFINQDEHNTPESAESLMGRGGCAMVLPTVNQKWQGLADPEIGAIPYTTDKMYFSVLLRVTDTSGKRLVYPYTDVPDMTVIYYAVDESGMIVSRVYPGDVSGEFFYNRELSQPYVAADGIEIRQYGWAAVPVDADWSAGKRYVYTLDYSEGIGIHDPEDPEPGKLIGGKEPIAWGVTVSNWSYAVKNDDYDPDVDVP